MAQEEGSFPWPELLEKALQTELAGGSRHEDYKDHGGLMSSGYFVKIGWAKGQKVLSSHLKNMLLIIQTMEVTEGF